MKKSTYSERYHEQKATDHKKAYWTVSNMKKAGSAYIDAIRTLRDAMHQDGVRAALRVSVSPGNVKTGAIPSVSMLPGVTCPAACKETCGVACYAWKIALLRSNVMRSYARNTALATLLPGVYWTQVKNAAMLSRWFRFHVAGDIPNARYFNRMIETVSSCPGTTFLCFTKRYNVVNEWIRKNGDLPSNLKLLFSGWTGLKPDNPYNLPETMVYGTEGPAENWLLCGGNCSECCCRGTGCWKAEKGETIAFKIH